jgi:hypothetical protein
MTIGSTAAQGSLRMRVVRAPRPTLTIPVLREFGMAQPRQPRHVKEWKNDNLPNLERGLHDLEEVKRGRGPKYLGALWATINHHDGDIDLGLISARVVTTVGVNYLVDAFQNLTELENMRYHGMGTGTTAEATTDTALVTELTTQYVVNSTRPTGTITEGATANIFQTGATVAVDAAVAITEHGVFSQAAVPGGVLLDRSVFAAVNLATSEAISFTYELSLPAGG